MGYQVVHSSDLPWEDRPSAGADGGMRQAADLTTAVGLAQSRARLWRLPAGTRGRRHLEHDQEEVFVVVEGTLTMLLGDPPERFELAPRSVASVQPGTPLQLRNESGADVLVLAYGAPPITGGSEHLSEIDA
jgi:uncharacterized cupin superfamily protein